MKLRQHQLQPALSKPKFAGWVIIRAVCVPKAWLLVSSGGRVRRIGGVGPVDVTAVQSHTLCQALPIVWLGTVMLHLRHAAGAISRHPSRWLSVFSQTVDRAAEDPHLPEPLTLEVSAL